MAASSMADNITAVATVITAVGGLLATLALLVPILRKTREVHTMVNQQRTDMRNYNNALISALKTAGVDVPADQSLTPPGENS